MANVVKDANQSWKKIEDITEPDQIMQDRRHVNKNGQAWSINTIITWISRAIQAEA